MIYVQLISVLVLMLAVVFICQRERFARAEKKRGLRDGGAE